MTGSDAGRGKSMQQGIDLAVEDINAAGGIKGRQLKVVTVDSRSDSLAGADAAAGLIRADKVPAIITALAKVTQAIIPVTEKNKVLLFTAATEPGLTEQGRYVFRNATSVRNEVDRMLKACREQLNLRKLAVVYVSSPEGIWVNNYVKREWEFLGGQVTASESLPLGAAIQPAQLERIKQTGPEAVYLLASRQNWLVIRLARQLGLKCQFLGTTDFELPEMLTLGADAEGAVYTRASFDPAAGTEPLATFRKRYRERNGREPDVFAATAYDATFIVAGALITGGASPDSARNAVLNVRDFPGVSGRTSFLPNGDADKPVELRKLERGRSVSFF
jgi:branched-chain amino acid transport system substrate-binding protein